MYWQREGSDALPTSCDAAGQGGGYHDIFLRGGDGTARRIGKKIDGLCIRMDVEPVSVLTRKVNDVVGSAVDYFSWLTGNSYPMPNIRVIDSPIAGGWEENPSTLVS